MRRQRRKKQQLVAPGELEEECVPEVVQALQPNGPEVEEHFGSEDDGVRVV